MMTLVSKALGAAAVAVIAPLVVAGSAAAEPYAQLPEVPVVVSPTCAGTTSAEAMVTPLQDGDRVESGVRVAIYFSSPNRDGSCAETVTATWTNLDTGATGTQDIIVVSIIDQHYWFGGYNRAEFWTGAGTVVVTVSTHPGAELVVTV
ncbi:hypothetical protein BH10ACT9_BH10ACT9_59550 [soil metagenome]